MDYISAKEAAEKWNLSIRRVQSYCASNKIPGAERVGKQWMIPKDAVRPGDGRTKEAKENGLSFPYHFPVFILSKYFVSQELLCSDEIQLLDAQILYLKGKFLKSIDLCRSLYATSSLPSVKYGAIITSCHNYYTMGISSMLTENLSVAEKMISESEKSNQPYTEDFRLLYADFIHHLSWDVKPFEAVNAEKLSVDAQLFYQSRLALLSSFVSETESKYSVSAFESLCFQTEAEGLLPVAMSLHFSLSSMYSILGNVEKRNKHIYLGCDIGLKNKWDHYLAKHSFISPQIISEYISSKDSEYSKQIKNIFELLVSSLVLIKKSKYGIIIPPDFYMENNELIHLLLCGMPDEAVAYILNISQEDVEHQIKNACIRYNLKDRQALITYSKELLSGENPKLNL